MDGTAARERTHFGRFLREVGDEIADDRNRRVPSTPRPRADWRRLSTETIPVGGESLRGLVYRACRTNDLPNSWGLLQYLGLPHRNRVRVSEDPNIDPAELAYAIRVAEHEVRSRRYDALETGSISFFGLELKTRSIETRIRRFSPTALQQPGQSFHRAVWELSDIPFCLENWDMLQDLCGCEGNGVVQGWTRTLTRIEECDKCGDPLAWLEPFEVPVQMRPELELLKAVVDPLPEQRQDAAHRLPSDLRTADRSAIFDIVVRIADAIDPDASTRSIEEPGERLNGLHRACVALSTWPHGLDRIPWHSDTAGAAIRSIHSDWHRLDPTTDGHLPRPSAAKSRRRESASAPTRSPTDTPSVLHEPGSATKESKRQKSTHVGIRPATEIAKLSPEVLLAAWQHGLVTRHERVHGPRSLPAFDPNELAELGAAFRSRVEPHSFAYNLGISYHGVEQLVALGVIAADAKALPGTGPHFTQATAASFQAKLVEPTMDLPSDAVPLTDAATLIGGRAKPWGPIFQALLNGAIKFALRDAARPVDRIMIRRGDVPKICALTFDRTQHPQTRFADRMIQRDAREMLNVNARGARLLEGLPSAGRVPQTFSVADVERRAAEVVSIPEIAAHMRVDAATAYQRLRRMSAREIIPGGWDRAHLATLLPTLAG